MRVARIYLAGASKEIALCEGYRDRLKAAGHEITEDWMVAIRGAVAADSVLPKEERARCARMDLAGVSLADIFWLVVPEGTSLGVWVELGYALAFKKQYRYSGGLGVEEPLVVVSGPWRSIFQDLADRTFATHEEAFAFLTEAERP